MLSNFHTHTCFCDGSNTPEEMVKSAIEKGFESLGFSGHGYTDFDHRYCMTDMDGYMKEIKRLKNEYKDEIQIYLGCEEDILGEVNRADFDYIIGSSHYVEWNGKLFDVDGEYDKLKECVDLYGGSLAYAEAYYQTFCEYILRRKPDIVGHFDLLTKYDECYAPLFLGDKEYEKIAEKYLKEALKSDCIFELNSGAISRGKRKTIYPAENLLHIIKKENGKVIINSDSHAMDTIDCHFAEMRKQLLDFGFEYTYTIRDGKFVKDYLK